MKFIWDEKKNQLNIKKHEVSFTQASSAFSDPFRKEYYDSVHSGPDEDRYILAGFAPNSILLISFMEPEPETVRIISARRANKIEEEELYNGNS